MFQVNQIIKFVEQMSIIRNDDWKEDNEVKNELSELIK